jgi:hypothetical protein
MKQHISVRIITTNKWKYFHLYSQVRDMYFTLTIAMNNSNENKKKSFIKKIYRNYNLKTIRT